MHRAGLASCRCRPLSSNVRPRKTLCSRCRTLRPRLPSSGTAMNGPQLALPLGCTSRQGPRYRAAMQSRFRGLPPKTKSERGSVHHSRQEHVQAVLAHPRVAGTGLRSSTRNAQAQSPRAWAPHIRWSSLWSSFLRYFMLVTLQQQAGSNMSFNRSANGRPAWPCDRLASSSAARPSRPSVVARLTLR